MNKIHKIRVLFTMESIPIHEIHIFIRILGHKMCAFVKYICMNEAVYVLDVNSLPNVNMDVQNFTLSMKILMSNLVLLTTFIKIN